MVATGIGLRSKRYGAFLLDEEEEYALNRER